MWYLRQVHVNCHESVFWDRYLGLLVVVDSTGTQVQEGPVIFESKKRGADASIAEKG